MLFAPPGKEMTTSPGVCAMVMAYDTARARPWAWLSHPRGVRCTLRTTVKSGPRLTQTPDQSIGD